MKNFAELDAKVCSCTNALTAKMNGMDGKLLPADTATRAQLAKLIMGFCEKM